MEIRFFVRAAMTIVASAFLGCSEQPSVPPTAEPSDNQVIVDPQEWCRDYWQDLKMSGSLNERRYDLDHDGVQEVFIEPVGGGGNAGNIYHVFKKKDPGYILMGDTFFHWRAFRVLPLATDGSIRFVTYHHMSSTEGTLTWWTHQNGEFQVIRTEVIHPGDGGTEEGRRRYAEVFGN